MHRVAVMGLCFMACAVVATGQFKGGEEKAPARKSDIPYIKCQVCQHLVREAARSIKKRRDGLNPGKKVKPVAHKSFYGLVFGESIDAGFCLGVIGQMGHQHGH